jgi:hypothetical protein
MRALFTLAALCGLAAPAAACDYGVSALLIQKQVVVAPIVQQIEVQSYSYAVPLVQSVVVQRQVVAVPFVKQRVVVQRVVQQKSVVRQRSVNRH